ncbi:MAG: CpsB/CapC family capsule biosynthesis tyrosine phosphatase [Cyclobacteriaceae bacterium]
MLGGIFSGKKLNLEVDIHSHLLPGIDDGVKSYDEAIEILQNFQSLGYRKIITTPHIYPEVYPNTPEIIREKFSVLQKKGRSYGLSLELDYAAEYFMDQHFLAAIKSGDEILSFSEGHVLVETPFYTRPMIFDEVMFELKARGFKPVFAHPERYQYLEKDLSWLRSLHQQDIKLQVNLPSLEGAYGEAPRKIAKKLINESLVSFFGSDIHRAEQLGVLRRASQQKISKNTSQNNELT